MGIQLYIIETKVDLEMLSIMRIYFEWPNFDTRNKIFKYSFREKTSNDVLQEYFDKEQSYQKYTTYV